MKFQISFANWRTKFQSIPKSNTQTLKLNRQSTIEYPPEHRPIATSPNRHIAQSPNRHIATSPNRHIAQSPNRPIIFLFAFLLSFSLFSQNQANVWHIAGDLTGVDFNTGEPVVIHDLAPLWLNRSNASMSDSLGNYLFSTCTYFVYDRYGPMQNCEDMIEGGTSGRAIVKWPGRKNIYYIFNGSWNGGFSYSLVDMTLNEGRGAVTDKNILLDAAWDAFDRVAIVKKEDTENVWVITRKFTDDAMAAFLVNENGVNPNPVISPMPDREYDPHTDFGFIKISYDKKYLISSYSPNGNLEICHFNASNGAFEYMYTITHSPNWGIAPCRGIEFSPDSKFLFSSYNDLTTYDSVKIYQFDMKLIADSALFMNSAILVAHGPGATLQLARDGKIYTTHEKQYNEEHYYWLSVIHQPWVRGTGCMYERNAINMFPGSNAHCLPNTLVDYLLRFEWTGETCQGYPIHFTPNFIPTPDSIVWNFGELAPGSVTTELSPTYSFKYPGVHEVKVDVWYPSGRYEHTSREIEILPSPQPDLGPDTMICQDASLVLSANCEADFFSWSTGQFGVSSITVSDSGTYWVRGRFNNSGCMGYDTIHVGFHAPAIIDETNLIITPTTCNGASGSITGLIALGYSPFAYRWKDLSEVEFGTDIDVFDLPAGQYVLTITDNNGCETVSDIHTIEDAGNLQVLNVEQTRPHCGRPDGQIIIHAFSPAGSALQYSIDDGDSYQTDSVFSGLPAASYVVRVTDGVGCYGFYNNNPVLLDDIPGPQVVDVIVTDETDFLGNGAIEIVATGPTPVIFYSIDSGATYQLNNGTFNNIGSGIYNLQIWDENGCDTTFTVEIQNIILTWLHAVTGEGGHCLGNTAMVPVNVDNFISVADFHLELGYNAGNLECKGFANVNVQLLDSLTGWVDPIAGDIHLTWSGELPLTFIQPEKVADLVFTTKNPGQGELSWYTGEAESYFTNSSGNPVPAEFSTGQVTIYQPPEIILEQSRTVCEGQLVMIIGDASGNQNPLTFRWIYPTGDSTSTDPFFFSVTPADAGLYTLLATDHVGCTDRKSIELTVSENPVAAFHGTDTLEMHAGEVLDAGEGMASYKWNTADSTQSIVIQAEGKYLVEMESQIGCIGRDSIYIKLSFEEIPDFKIFIPNAFSPDGDGINDSFQIKLTNSTFNIQHSTLRIFDRWGGEVFFGDGISSGWDGKKNGKECPGGVYVYKIVFSVDGVPGSQERVGTVMLVR
ncbi:MAG: gliding motility-associated C-terminal domain-containing protein [Bacteroidales bacterium]|nr:gliding motility-associated C-terminal domain-containing protein [Bacteroidales bacterium]